MKKFIVSLILVGLTNLIAAQNDLAVVLQKPVINKSKTIAIKNAAYLNNTSIDNTAKHIILLHKKVAEFNVRELDIYTPQTTTTYDVVFTEGNNTIKATYNHNGDIISCNELFEGIRLPYSISSKLSKEYPGWEFSNTWCAIEYYENNQTKIVYTIRLKNGSKTKMIKINP